MKTLRPAVLALLILVAPPVVAAPRPPPPPAAPPPPTEADWRTPDPQNVLVIDTNRGRIIVELSPIATPNHAARVRELTRAGLYNGRAFFRVLDNFMDQTGDPIDSGAGTSSLPNLKGEMTFRRGTDTPFTSVDRTGGIEQGFVGSLPVISQATDLGLLTADHKVDAWGAYCAGVLGMARGEDVDSANSQFFLMRTNASAVDHANHALDKRYTAFGRTLVGQDVIDSIKTGQPVPQPQDRMMTVRVLADIPQAERPNVRVIDTNGAWFKAQVAYLRATLGPDFTACSVSLPAEVR